jgi:iron(II)-dependent oxidoreductase
LRRWAWGDEANDGLDVGLAQLRPARVGQFSASAAACGAEQLCGSVWEWVSDVFAPYPGFRPQAYAGYSQPWFDGKHRVARGGSYMTDPALARAAFRNWYTPDLREPCLGLRLAR